MSLIDEVRATRGMPHHSTARMIRESAKITQSRMAAELGVDRTTLSRWEAGTSQPRAEQRLRWAQLLTELQQVMAS